MKRILGLDLGTTSIGWALVNEAETKEERSSIVKMGVRVVPLTTDEKDNYQSGKDVQTNAGRTMKRSARRNLQRFKLRRENLIKCLREHNIISDDIFLCEDGPSTTFQTLRLRAKAATEEISLDELSRVLLMINKKRGYKSSRKAAGGDEGSLIDGMEIARDLQDRQITPGQKVLELLESGKKYIPDFYRSDLRAELDRIWEIQRTFYPAILTDDFYKLTQSRGRNEMSKIFYARYDTNTAQNSGKDKRLQSYRWRVEALTNQLPVDVLAYVICDLCGQISGSSNYLASISDRSKELFFGDMTVGQYLMAQLDANPNTSLKNQVFYRQDYLDEFNRIWDIQQQYHPELTEELRTQVRDYCIFYQRPLRSQHNLIANCEFEHKTTLIDGKEKVVGMKVCPKSSPLFQTFKIWQVLNNLQLIDSTTDERLPLSLEQKQMLYSHLRETSRMTKSDALRILFGKKPKHLDLNYKELLGDETMAAIKSALCTIAEMSGHDNVKGISLDDLCLLFGTLGWKTDYLSFNPLAEGKDLVKQPFYQLWHLLYSYEGDDSPTGNDSLIGHLIDITGIPREYISPLANITFKEDYGSLCAKAIRKILPHMLDGLEYSVACEYAGYRHSAHSPTKEERDSRELKDSLEILPRNSLRNPVVEKILNQMIHVTNGICATYGKPDEIRIEMARELKKSKSEREEMTRSIGQTTRENEAIVKILQAAPYNLTHVSRNDILRYRLYQELKGNGYHTLYTNTYIPQEALFSRDFDIEHIIPQARLFDDSFSNKTLELRTANIAKGSTTALDYVSSTSDTEGIDQYRNRVEALFTQGAISRTKRNKLLMREGDIPEGFLNRDLTNTQYIARQAVEILESLVRIVTPTTGSITDRLREDWQIVDVMQELNWDKYDRIGQTYFYQDRDGKTIGRIKDWTKRNDHRHHAMDAVTIAFTRPAIIQYLNNMAARSDKAGTIYAIEQQYLYRSNGSLRFLPPMPLGDFRKAVKEQLEAILVSFKAKNKVMTENVNRYMVKGEERKKKQLTPRGQLHNETVYGRIEQYQTAEVKLGSKMTVEVAQTVANKRYREAILERLATFGNDPKKAFCGKNSTEKNPLYLDEMQTSAVPAMVQTACLQPVYTIRKPVAPGLNIDKVIDVHVREILMARLAAFGGDDKKAFANLDENPIWLNEERGIAIKRVTIVGASSVEPIHCKHNHKGEIICDTEGKYLPADYIAPNNNHHIAFYLDAAGSVQDIAVSFIEATERARQGMPIVDKSYHSTEGWSFLFSMKQNEYFVFANPETGFNPHEVDLMDSDNASLISANLYRVQKFSKTESGREYVFRHHLETTLNDSKELLGCTFKRCKSLGFVNGIVKVRLNHLGQVAAVGEY